MDEQDISEDMDFSCIGIELAKDLVCQAWTGRWLFSICSQGNITAWI